MRLSDHARSKTQEIDEKIEQTLFNSLYLSSTLVTCLPSLLLASDFHYLSFFLFVPSLSPLPPFAFSRYLILLVAYFSSYYAPQGKSICVSPPSRVFPSYPSAPLPSVVLSPIAFLSSSFFPSLLSLSFPTSSTLDSKLSMEPATSFLGTTPPLSEG